jgi:hypothetical protein
MLKRMNCAALLAAGAFVSPSGLALADDGIVRVKSAYDMPERLKRLKKDVADKGIVFFSEIDQAKLAASAGVTLLPSTLLVFGNPPLGTLFITSRPRRRARLAGQAARLPGRRRPGLGGLHGFRLDRAATASPTATRNSTWPPG